jgi:hypothetical protein
MLVNGGRSACSTGAVVMARVYHGRRAEELPLRTSKKLFTARSMSHVAAAAHARARETYRTRHCPHCGTPVDATDALPALGGEWWHRHCWTAGHDDPGGVTKGKPMTGTPVIDFDSDEGRKYLEHWRSVPTPPRERSRGRLTDCWADIPTPTLMRHMVDGLCARAMPGTHPVTAASRDFYGMSLLEMARVVLRRRGRSFSGRGALAQAALQVGRSPETLLDVNTRQGAQAYLVTDDFVSVLLNLARASLTQGYTVAPRTFTSWARQISVQDFRQHHRIAVGAGPRLDPISQHGEFTRGALPSRSEIIQLQTFGKIIAFTRQALINDDLDLLTRLPQLFGNSAATMEGDVVYGVLTGNPVMSDGFALFSSQHKNVGTPAAITIASMSEARQLLRTQTSPDGQALNLTPAFLVCGPVMEVEALQLTAATVVPTTLGTAIPVALKSVEVVVDPRIQGTNWYIMCSPNACDGIEYARLAGGDEGPTLEARDGFDVDGVEFKCREDFAAVGIEWRGMIWNAGA